MIIRPNECQLDEQIFFMIAGTENPCKRCTMECSHAIDYITIGGKSYQRRKSSESLPQIPAFCRECGENTAKPIAAIWFNGRKGILVGCKKHNPYPLYEIRYKQEVSGFININGKYVAPESCKNSYDKITSIRYAPCDEWLSKFEKDFGLHFNEETRASMIKEYEMIEKERIELLKKDNEEFQERRQELNLSRAVKQADRIRTLKEQGLVKYKDGCLYHKDTGELLFKVK